MKNIVFLLNFLVLQISVFAQISDDFSDTDLNNNPTWTGNSANFTVENGVLRSNGANLANSKIYLSTTNTLIDNVEWNFLIDLKFNPTATNYIRVYLASNQANLQGSLNGYFIQIGQTNADFIKFFRQDGATNTELFSGATSLGSGNIKVRIKVTRLLSGEWQIFSDANGGQNFVSEGNPFTENTYKTTAYFGFNCTYATASRYNLYYFDDIFVKPLVIDTEPPTIQNFKLLSANQLQLDFSEQLEIISAQAILNYSVNNEVGNPSNAVLDAINKNSVMLTFAKDFPSQVECILTVQNIQDLAKNVMLPQNFKFTFIRSFSPVYNELIISEIMADPRGSAQPLSPLLDTEYVEIYNQGKRILNLKNCTFNDATSSKILPEYLLFPNEYVILVDNTQIADFQTLGKTIGLTSFPSLTNSGELLTLKNANNELLFALEYSDDWYQNNSKKDGGWSLEIIDVNAPCREGDNWRASEASRGGTPGKINSIQESQPDQTAPNLVRALALDNQTIQVVFNEKMNAESLSFKENYSINQNIDIQSVTILDNLFFKTVQLKISSTLQTQITYQITVKNVSDCAGNLIQDQNTTVFGLSEQGDSLDIILNEILFNPFTGGSDFVELYNNSNKFINLKDWKIANLTDGIIANQTLISNTNWIISPKSYLVLTTDIPNIQSNYPRSLEEAKINNFLKMSSLPSYNDDEGNFFLINNLGKLLERFDYQDDFHNPLLDKKDGVSLEKIAFNLPTHSPNSWQSASASEGYATPGYPNSQTLNANGNSGIQVNPRVFTPNGDGNQDFTSIELSLDKSGYVVNISIFDRNGLEIKQLVKNQLLGTSNNFIWDGTDAQGNRALTGSYLLYIKALSANGEQKVWKEKVVVGTRF